MTDSVHFSVSTKKAIFSIILNGLYGGFIVTSSIEYLVNPGDHLVFLIMMAVLVADACRTVLMAIVCLVQRPELLINSCGIVWRTKLIPWSRISEYHTSEYSHRGIVFQSSRTLTVFDPDYPSVKQQATSLWGQFRLHNSSKYRTKISLSFFAAKNDEIREAMDQFFDCIQGQTVSEAG